MNKLIMEEDRGREHGRASHDGQTRNHVDGHTCTAHSALAHHRRRLGSLYQHPRSPRCNRRERGETPRRTHACRKWFFSLYTPPAIGNRCRLLSQKPRTAARTDVTKATTTYTEPAEPSIKWDTYNMHRGDHGDLPTASEQ